MGPVAGFLELHIEQGLCSSISVCPSESLQASMVVSAVDNLRGRSRPCRHDTHGPSARRPVGAARAVLAIDALAREGDIEIATAGALQVRPGNANVIAGQASVSFDLRSPDDDRARHAVEQLANQVADIGDGTSTTGALSLTTSTCAVATDEVWRQSIGEAAAGLGLASRAITSGAGHDAQQLTKLGPVGMIFVPSTGGISHNAAEATDADHLVAGAPSPARVSSLADAHFDP